MITVFVDELTHCLIDSSTGKEVETFACPISDSKTLENCNEENGWYVNWAELCKENEVYALFVKGNNTIQGLVALRDDILQNAIYANWIVANPHNNAKYAKEQNVTPKYIGVGGHLFAIACNRSLDLGHGGCMYGYAANQKLLAHYVNKFHALPLRVLHPFHFLIDEDNAIMLIEEYTYDIKFECKRKRNVREISK